MKQWSVIILTTEKIMQSLKEKETTAKRYFMFTIMDDMVNMKNTTSSYTDGRNIYMGMRRPAHLTDILGQAKTESGL